MLSPLLLLLVVLPVVLVPVQALVLLLVLVASRAVMGLQGMADYISQWLLQP